MKREKYKKRTMYLSVPALKLNKRVNLPNQRCNLNILLLALTGRQVNCSSTICSIIFLCIQLPPFCGLPKWLSGKESAFQCRSRRFNPWVGKIPWRRKWQLTSVFFPRNFHGQKSLADYSWMGHKRVEHNLASKQEQHAYIF